MRHRLMLTCLALCACGGGGGSNTTISLTTKPTSIPAGSTFVFMAGTQHNGGAGQGVTWTLTPASGEGSLSNLVNDPVQKTSQITYTAPAASCSNCVTITATSVANPAASDSCTFSIAP